MPVIQRHGPVGTQPLQPRDGQCHIACGLFAGQKKPGRKPGGLDLFGLGPAAQRIARHLIGAAPARA